MKRPSVSLEFQHVSEPAPSAPLPLRIVRFLWALRWFFAAIAGANFGGFVLGPMITPSETAEVLKWFLGMTAMIIVSVCAFAVYIIMVTDVLPGLRRLWEDTK